MFGDAIFGFLICSFIIFYAGKNLSLYGDRIGHLTGLSGVWIGLVMMAIVTSLPELAIGISSVSIVGSADLAVGGVLGSCIFNLAILSLLDALSPGQPLLTRVAGSHVLAVSLTTILLSMIALGLFLPNDFIVIGWIGVTSLFFIIMYLLSIKLMHGMESQRKLIELETEEDKEIKKKYSLRSSILAYIFHAALVIIAGMIIPSFAETIAIETKLGESFVGTVFLAASSSLPEMAVAISAARIGAVDMAVGNLFGSNIFNILTLSINDIFYTKGYLLKDASDVNQITVFSVIAMNSVAIAALTIKPEKKRFHYLAWDTLIILLIYMSSMVLLLGNS
jgi:cation:H+ antiporter